MSRIGKIFREAAKHPDSWVWETSSHVKHIPTRTTLYAPGPIRLQVYDEKIMLGFWESIVIRFRMLAWNRKQNKAKRKAKEAAEFQRISNAMLGIDK